MTTAAPDGSPAGNETAYRILLAISLCHMLNDVMQSLIAATYPMLKAEFQLDYWHVGLMTAAFQATAAVLQPVVGLLNDRRPMPASLPMAMASTGTGLALLAWTSSYAGLLAGAALVGIGSSVFHPESSRVARAASGGRFGLAQSVFQVGGNFGSSLGPLLAAFIVLPLGRPSIAWFMALALLAMAILTGVARWSAHVARRPRAAPRVHGLPRRKVARAITILLLLVFSKYVYLAAMTSYYTFFLIERFGVSTDSAQILLFVFLGAVALGTVIGGPVGDRIGRRTVIWISILGTLPFTLLLPHAGLVATAMLSVVIGVVLASAFSSIVVFAQELLPNRIGAVAGMFFGFAFGIGGVSAAALGVLADDWGIETVFRYCAFLPAMGVLAIFLPRRL
ncbi:MFS transporter [Frigidibacter sp. ROC022]|uniref:MFS transporter n=1 Tax=Frigidibacter sp. ROC022 TaxID=2971796 RepID=UPI00215AA788|nr:MFS transporter [Frigidibacter sp. ROC022]MCR8724595.1 MFS transporter [Frigidibacter sp. ROC022]